MLKMYWDTLFLVFFAAGINCHSWIEQLTVVAPNGTFVGAPGYPRGNVRRGAPGFSDTAMVNLIPPNGGSNQITPDMRMCKDSQRSPQNQPSDSPVLQAAPGAAIALRFQENGHVTLPQTQPGKPENRGNIYVYGTSDSKPDDTLLGIHKQWNAAGTGGDKRGKLLSVSSFDDGRCYQINSGQISQQRQKQFAHTPNQLMGADIWCQQDLALPTDIPNGELYTLYWVWDWPTAPNVGLPQGKAEIYTTCMDIRATSNLAVAQKSDGNSFIQNQDLNSAAIPDQMANLGTTYVGRASPDGENPAAA